MCFSAGASFTAGTIISAVGIATIKDVNKPSKRIFAAIPLLFGIQQIAEGCLWLTLQNPDYVNIQKISTFIFLFTADVIWPVMIPLSILLMEEDGKRRRILKILLITGILLSLYYAFFLIFYEITPQVRNCHIFYETASPKSLEIPAFLLYIVVMITSLFVSGIKKMYLIGILMFLACVVSVIFYTKNVTSVWCFFAALISIIIYWIIKESAKQKT